VSRPAPTALSANTAAQPEDHRVVVAIPATT